MKIVRVRLSLHFIILKNKNIKFYYLRKGMENNFFFYIGHKMEKARLISRDLLEGKTKSANYFCFLQFPKSKKQSILLQ